MEPRVTPPAPAAGAMPVAADATPAAADPERQIAFDMLRRGLPVLPVLVVAGAIGWGVDGALSSLFGVALVLANLVLSATMLAWAAKRGPAMLMGTALGGFLVRMVLLVVAVALVRDQPWLEVVPLGITVLVTHVGLLAWESRHVSASLAYPGLKPRRTGA